MPPSVNFCDMRPSQMPTDFHLYLCGAVLLQIILVRLSDLHIQREEEYLPSVFMLCFLYNGTSPKQMQSEGPFDGFAAT